MRVQNKDEDLINNQNIVYIYDENIDFIDPNNIYHEYCNYGIIFNNIGQLNENYKSKIPFLIDDKYINN